MAATPRAGVVASAATTPASVRRVSFSAAVEAPPIADVEPPRARFSVRRLQKPSHKGIRRQGSLVELEQLMEAQRLANEQALADHYASVQALLQRKSVATGPRFDAVTFSQRLHSQEQFLRLNLIEEMASLRRELDGDTRPRPISHHVVSTLRQAGCPVTNFVCEAYQKYCGRGRAVGGEADVDEVQDERWDLSQRLITRRFVNRAAEHAYQEFHFSIWKPRIRRVALAYSVLITTLMALTFVYEEDSLPVVAFAGMKPDEPMKRFFQICMVAIPWVSGCCVWTPILTARRYPWLVSIPIVIMQGLFCLPAVVGFEYNFLHNGTDTSDGMFTADDLYTSTHGVAMYVTFADIVFFAIGLSTGLAPLVSSAIILGSVPAMYLRQKIVWERYFDEDIYPLPITIHFFSAAMAILGAYMQSFALRRTFTVKLWQVRMREQRCEQLAREKQRLEFANAIRVAPETEDGGGSEAPSSQAASTRTDATPVGTVRRLPPRRRRPNGSGAGSSTGSRRRQTRSGGASTGGESGTSGGSGTGSSSWPAEQATEDNGMGLRIGCYPSNPKGDAPHRAVHVLHSMTACRPKARRPPTGVELKPDSPMPVRENTLA